MLLAAISVLLTSICEASWSETVYSFEARQEEAPTKHYQDWTVHEDDYWVTGFHYGWSSSADDAQFEWYYGRPSGAVNTASQPTETLEITTALNKNDYDRICSSNYAVYSVESTHSESFESAAEGMYHDRLFTIICKKLPPLYTTGACKWLPEGDNVHDYLNYNSDISDDGKSFDYKCGDSPYADIPALLTGIKSNYGSDEYIGKTLQEIMYHSDPYRRFKFRCCDIEYNPIDIVEEYDNSRVLVQIESIFDINDGVRTLKMTGFGKPKWYTENGGNPVTSLYPLMRTLPYDDSRSFIRICPKNGAFSSITSNDDNTFEFECAELDNDVVMSDCEWTDYLNAFHGIFTGETGLCPKDGGIRGIQTYHSLRSDDYRIKSYCCEFKSGTFDSNPPIYIKAITHSDTDSGSLGLITFDLCWNGDLYQGIKILNANDETFIVDDITKYDSCGSERLLTVSTDSTDNLRIESIAVIDHNIEYIIKSFYDHTSYSESATDFESVDHFVLNKDDESVTALIIKFPHDYLTECQGGDGCIGDLYLLEDFKLYLMTLTPCASFVLATAGNQVMNTMVGKCRDEDGTQRPDHTTDYIPFEDVAINECKSKLVDKYLKNPSYVTAEYNKDEQTCWILKQLGYTGNGNSDYECITMKTNHDESDIGVTFEDTRGQCRNSDGSKDINHSKNMKQYSNHNRDYCEDRFMEWYESDNNYVWMQYAHSGSCWIGYDDLGYTGNGKPGDSCYNIVSLANTDTDAVYSNLDLETTQGVCRYPDDSTADDHSCIDFTDLTLDECENQLIVKHIEDPQYVNAQYRTSIGKCCLRKHRDYTGNGLSGYKCIKIIYSTDIGVIVRGLKGNLDKEILEGPISDEEFVGFGNIGDVFHVSIEYESGDDYCIERATLYNEFIINGIQEYGREYFGDGIILSKSCETDPDFRYLSGNKYVPCYDTAFNIITYEASLYTSVQIHACDGDKGGVGAKNAEKLSLIITGKTDSDTFIQSDPLSLQSSSEWESGESRDYTLQLFGAMTEISLITITNNDENDYLCVDSVIINGEDAFLKDYWVGLDNAADADDDSGVKQTIPAVLKWPICKIELTTTIEARSSLPTNPDTVATSTCVNRNRLTSVNCDISQSIETYEELSWEHQMGEELSNEITMERGTSMELSESLTVSGGVEIGGDSATVKKIFGAELTGGRSRGTSKSRSTSHGETTIDITTDGRVNGESISVDCSGSVSVPPSQQMEYSLMLDRTTAELKTLTDMKMTKCSKYLYNKDEDDPNDYIYIYDIEGKLTETSATNCYVEFGQSELVNTDITCGEERALATREWGTYIPQCDPNDSTYYDQCQCAFGVYMEQKTCGCVDTFTGNLMSESEASVVSETEEYGWRDWCKDHCGINGSVIFEAETGSAKAPPSNVEPIVMNEDVSERNKKEKFLEYNFNILALIGLFMVIAISFIGVFIYGLNSCYQYKLNPNKYHSVPTFYSETEVEKV